MLVHNISENCGIQQTISNAKFRQIHFVYLIKRVESAECTHVYWCVSTLQVLASLNWPVGSGRLAFISLQCKRGRVSKTRSEAAGQSYEQKEKLIFEVSIQNVFYLKCEPKSEMSENRVIEYVTVSSISFDINFFFFC